MPRYDFVCNDCGRLMEVRKGMNEPDPACDMCGSAVDQVIGAPGLVFTGSGFYITDYKKKVEGQCKTT